MLGNIIKKTCLPVVLAVMVAVLLSGCAVEYEVKLEAEPEDAGAVTGSGTYSEGETITIKAEAEEGYTFDQKVAGVIKDGKLSFIDREGNQLVEPVDVDYDDNFSFQLEYLEGPEVYKGPNYNYFDLEGWIWKP